MGSSPVQRTNSTRIACLSVPNSFFRWEFDEDINPHSWIRDKEYIYDADSCGERTTYWVMVADRPHFYRCYHEWYWDYVEEGNCLYNHFDIVKLSQDEIVNKEAEANFRYIV